MPKIKEYVFKKKPEFQPKIVLDNKDKERIAKLNNEELKSYYGNKRFKTSIIVFIAAIVMTFCFLNFVLTFFDKQWVNFQKGTFWKNVLGNFLFLLLSIYGFSSENKKLQKYEKILKELK